VGNSQRVIGGGGSRTGIWYYPNAFSGVCCLALKLLLVYRGSTNWGAVKAHQISRLMGSQESVEECLHGKVSTRSQIMSSFYRGGIRIISQTRLSEHRTLAKRFSGYFATRKRNAVIVPRDSSRQRSPGRGRVEKQEGSNQVEEGSGWDTACHARVTALPGSPEGGGGGEVASRPYIVPSKRGAMKGKRYAETRARRQRWGSEKGGTHNFCQRVHNLSNEGK